MVDDLRTALIKCTGLILNHKNINFCLPEEKQKIMTFIHFGIYEQGISIYNTVYISP